MSVTPIENKANQKKILQNNSTFSKENLEESDEDTEISNIDSNQSFNDFSIVQRISSTLEGIINKNEAENTENNLVDYDHSPFTHKTVPKISIEDYLNRIQKYSELEDSTLIIALIYIDRLLENKNIKLSIYNVHRILFTAVLLAIKYNEDEIYENNIFAEIFGVSNKELNNLESEFLDLIEFNLFITKKIFQLYYNKIYD